jgi:hypothetical protein
MSSAVAKSRQPSQAPNAIVIHCMNIVVTLRTRVSPVALSATGVGSDNPVTFSATGPGSVSGNMLAIIGAGTVVVAANQAGNANYSAAKVTKSITVNKSPQGITFSPLAGPVTCADNLSASSTSGLVVSFKVLSGPQGQRRDAHDYRWWDSYPRGRSGRKRQLSAYNRGDAVHHS